MLNITYLYFGQQKDEYFRKGMDEYIKRIGKYAKFNEKVLKPENLPDNPTQSGNGIRQRGQNTDLRHRRNETDDQDRAEDSAVFRCHHWFPFRFCR